MLDSSHSQILPYDSNWVSLYEHEAEKLRTIFADSLLGIEHIGSTSVSGLISKPIIDIAVLIKSYKDIGKFILPVSELGYPFDGEIDDPKNNERYFFRKGNPTQYHLSIAFTDRGGFWKRQIAFRDYLRSHPEERDEYGALKLKLIEDYPDGGHFYIHGKTDLINEILDKSGFKRWKPNL